MTEHPPLPKPAPAEAPADPRASPLNRAATLLLVVAFALVAGAGAALTATRAAASSRTSPRPAAPATWCSGRSRRPLSGRRSARATRCRTRPA